MSFVGTLRGLATNLTERYNAWADRYSPVSKELREIATATAKCVGLTSKEYSVSRSLGSVLLKFGSVNMQIESGYYNLWIVPICYGDVMVRAESKKGEKLSSRLWTLDNGITINYCRGSIERLPEMLMEAIDNAADISDEFKRYGRGGRLSDETPKFPCEGYAGKRFPEIG